MSVSAYGLDTQANNNFTRGKEERGEGHDLLPTSCFLKHTRLESVSIEKEK